METNPDETLYRFCVIGIYLFAIPSAISLESAPSPYGKHRQTVLTISSSSLAWFIMECPTIFLTIFLFPYGRHASNPKAIFVMSIYLLHYFNRTFLHPLRIRIRSQTDRGFPVSVAGVGFFYNLLNAYLQSRWVSHYENDYSGPWFWGRLVIGLVVFTGGMWLNVWSDMVLVGLKKNGDGGYKVPRGGLFELVSCPNYFGEILEWLGWTIITGSYGAFGFLVCTCAILIPRARATHKWYLDTFKYEYPKGRKVFIPFVY